MAVIRKLLTQGIFDCYIPAIDEDCTCENCNSIMNKYDTYYLPIFDKLNVKLSDCSNYYVTGDLTNHFAIFLSNSYKISCSLIIFVNKFSKNFFNSS